MKTNYFLSGCTANFGVDPWFSLACFLLAPIFFFFSFLWIRVCVVLEAISKSLSCLINYKYKEIFLTFVVILVKVFILLTPCDAISATASKDIILSKGEQTQLTIGKLKNFSVGNKEVIKYKYRQASNEILISAKSMGYSDLVAWKTNGEKLTFHIYVTSKREQLKKMEIIQVLKNTNLKTEISGDLIYVSGEVNSEKEYLIIKQIESTKNPKLILNVQLSHSIIQKLIGTIYKEFYEQGFDSVSCEYIKTNIFCDYQGGSDKHPIVKKFEHLYRVSFKGHSVQDSPSNLKVRFHIVSLESINGTNRSMGINRIQSNLASAIKSDGAELETGDILFKDSHMKAKLLAKPEIQTTLDNKFQLQLGSEVPVESRDGEHTTTTWKFYGLKLSGILTLKHNKLLLNHSAEFTQLRGEGHSGPKGKSSIYIDFGSQAKLFTILMEMSNQDSASIPGLSRIPLFKHLFQEQSTYFSKKEIHVFATILKE